MTIKKHIDDEKGFTIQELAVVLAVGSLLFIFSFILFSFIQKTYHVWTDRLDQSDAFVRASSRLMRDIQGSEAVYTADDTTCLITMIDGDTVVYRFSVGQLKRNDIVLLESDSIQVNIQTYSEITSSKQKIDLHFSAKSPNYTVVKATIFNLRGERQRFSQY